MTSQPPTTLRALLAEPTVEPGPYAYPQHLAESVLGLNVAPSITWAYADGEGAFYGQLRVAGDPTGETVILRTEATEPGAERLEVNVPCPADPTCRDAYDYVNDPGVLISALAGDDEPYGDVLCYTHDLDDLDDDDDDDLDDDE